MIGKLLFLEISRDVFEHQCDDEIRLYSYPKDRSLNQMRRDLFLASSDLPKREALDLFAQVRHTLKSKNKEIRKQKVLADLMSFIGIRFVQVPSFWKIAISDARIVRHDGNHSVIVATSIDKFYCIKWSGS